MLSVLLTFAPLNSKVCSTFLSPSAAALCRGRQSFQPEESNWALLGRKGGRGGGEVGGEGERGVREERERGTEKNLLVTQDPSDLNISKCNCVV